MRTTADGKTERGFQVNVAGGTSTMARSGYLLYEFVPVSEMFNVAEAIVRVYHKHGDYAHKHKNRMKFLIRSLGWDRYKRSSIANSPACTPRAASRFRSIPTHFRSSSRPRGVMRRRRCSRRPRARVRRACTGRASCRT